MKNLVLTGMPGSGKTKMGRILAQRFGLPLVDTDQMVVERAGKTIPEIFAEDGEKAFRDIETAAVLEAAALPGAVIATGGGVILREENMAALRCTGLVFFRDRSPAAIVGEDLTGRPLIGSDSERVYRLYKERLPLYQKYAHHTIPHTDTYEEAAEMIAALFEKEAEQ
ncbi:MAG: shikimate kinase [Oscillospiraceae bacterium]|nr:shikimate kinase [Oscillospiraceae bacterium]